ncbi:hypothetical protein BaRGS_00023492 [Batillaria attramentaria]|uniref:Uncharacterized protein n=1 Tax=Batillaria attramentaria TaxID=370345 RepID=A0ABD0KE00_9CAEN
MQPAATGESSANTLAPPTIDWDSLAHLRSANNSEMSSQAQSHGTFIALSPAVGGTLRGGKDQLAKWVIPSLPTIST